MSSEGREVSLAAKIPSAAGVKGDLLMVRVGSASLPGAREYLSLNA